MNTAQKEVSKPKPSNGFKNQEISIAVKVTATIILLIIAVSFTTNYIIYTKSLNALQQTITNHLKITASHAALLIDAEMLKTIHTAADENSQNYKELQRRLQAFQHGSQDKLHYVYTIMKSGSSYRYGIDAAPISDDKNHSPAGSPFPIDNYPAALTGFLRPTAESKPVFDTEFNILSQSGYAPIQDTRGNVIGVVGVDMDVTTLKIEKAAMLRAAGAASSVGIILALFLGFLFSRYLTRPIFLLIRGTESIASGHLDQTVTINRNDEYGRLAKAFNKMAASLKMTRNTLDQHQQHLEETVADRTQELARTNQEIREILNHIGQAIFTINSDLRLNPEHSRFAETLFGRTDFAGATLSTLFFPESPSKEMASLESWLKMVFYGTVMTWEDLLPIQPIDELHFTREDSHDIYVRLHFMPISEASGITPGKNPAKMMVIIEDVTEARRLSLQIEEKEQEHQENINQIIEFIQMDQGLFAEFIQECKDQLTDMEPQLRALSENPLNSEAFDELYRSVHTIKGNAGTFNLGKIVGKAHQIETLLTTIHTGDLLRTEKLISAIDEFHGYCVETFCVYERILREKTIDIGRVRTKHRLEKEYVKVKVEGLRRLSALFERADSIVSMPDGLSSILAEAKTTLGSMDYVPISRVFGRLPRIVQDISQELGKKARLIIDGDDIEIQSEHFDAIANSIIHLLRNSLDHGIETPSDRRLLGKSEEGLIKLSILVDEDDLIVSIEDDGRGLDIEAIKHTAISKGLIQNAASESLTDEEAVKLIFLPGFSTHSKITKFSGRGVGMDIIRNNIESQLKGRVHLESSENGGLKVTMTMSLKSYGEVSNG